MIGLESQSSQQRLIESLIASEISFLGEAQIGSEHRVTTTEVHRMKCQSCFREIKIGLSTCPYCQKRQPSRSYSTINDATQTLEQHSRRRLLQQVIQFSLVAVTFIVLASFIRFDPPKANTPEPVRSAEAASPTPLPASPVIEAPVLESAPAPVTVETLTARKSVAKPQTISLFSAEDMRRANGGATSATTPRPVTPPVISSTVSLMGSAPLITKKPRSADEAKPKKVVTPIVSLPSSTTPAPAPEPEPKLEIEGTGVSLHPNTGLVTIKSYVPARVYIDGVYSGATPRSVKLLAGEHTISLLADGYHEYSRKIKVNGQQQLGILASMSKK